MKDGPKSSLRPLLHRPVHMYNILYETFIALLRCTEARVPWELITINKKTEILRLVDISMCFSRFCSSGEQRKSSMALWS